MTESTEMIALWNRREPKTDEEMVEEFMRFLDCFERPYLENFQMTYANPSAQYAYSDEARAKRTDGLTAASIRQFFRETTGKKSHTSQLTELGGYGVLLLDIKRYASGREWFGLGRTGIHWSGLNPHLYSDGVKRIEDTGIATKPVPEEEVERIIDAASKKIISSFKPEIYAFYRGNADYLNSSKILYFRNPYLFCLELEPGEFELSGTTQKKLDEIMAVLNLDELVRLLAENAEQCGYDVFHGPDEGVGICVKWGMYRISPEARYAQIVPFGRLRKMVREKGVELPEGDIDKHYEYYVDSSKAKNNDGRRAGRAQNKGNPSSNNR